MNVIFTSLKFGVLIKAIFLLFCCALLNSSFGQTEKRLALVIGNANYEKGELKNPENDAKLMARTLDSLGFDVILATNIENQRSFLNTIREFGNRRVDYDVGFVYYAGHGVQIAGENYLLPTKEIYDSKDDIEDFAVHVNKIMKYLTAMTNQVNILILDACRDNPFEKNWNTTRSIKGEGLAKIPPPTGSLIAFSTDAGNTAADGEQKNSIYCQSLSENMLLNNVSLDQIFRNVRSEVLNKTNGNQRPVEASQLTGNAFYLKKSDYSRLESDINILIKKDDYLSALPLSGKLIALDSNNYWAYALQGDIYFYLDLEEKADELFKKAIKINPEISSLYYRLAESYYYQDYPDLALEEIEKAIKLDPRDESNLHLKSKILGSNKNYNEALVSINKALKLNPSSSILYYRKSKIWDDLGDYNKALKAIDSAIIIDPDIDLFYYNRGLFKSYLYDFEEAIKDFNVSIELDPNDPDYYRLRGQAYDKLGLEDKAREDYNEALAIYDDNALNNLLKGRIFALPIFANVTSAIKYYSRSIKFEETSEAYVGRAEVYSLMGNNEKALSDFDKAIEISPEEPQPYRDRGYFYYEIGENQASINDYNKSLSLTDNSNLSEAMQDKYEIALNLLQLEKTYQAMDELRSIIKNSKNAKTDKYFLSQVYTTVGAIYQWIENDFDKSIKNYDKAISLFPTIRDPYIRKAELYANNNQITLAKNVYSTLMKIDSGSVSHQFKGRMNYLLKKFDQAILIFNKVIELDPRETEAYFYLSKIYFDQQKYFDALEMMSNTVKWHRDFKNGYWLTNENFTSCHFGPIERKINSCSPDLIDLLKNRAKIYKQLNANNKACEDYAESCELGDCENYNSYCK